MENLSEETSKKQDAAVLLVINFVSGGVFFFFFGRETNKSCVLGERNARIGINWT